MGFSVCLKTSLKEIKLVKCVFEKSLLIVVLVVFLFLKRDRKD